MITKRLTALAVSVPLALGSALAGGVPAEAASTTIVSNSPYSKHAINTYSDDYCKKDRRITDPGYGTKPYGDRNSYRVRAVSYISVPGGAEKRVASDVCYNFGQQSVYKVRVLQ